MKLWLANILNFFILTGCINAQSDYHKYFTNKALRIDFTLAGNHLQQSAFLLNLIQEPVYGGRTHHLMDSLHYGDYLFYLTDLSSGDTLYSGGFCALFQEWQTTEEAKTMNRAFIQSLQLPYPKQPVQLSISARTKNSKQPEQLLTFTINPEDQNITKSPAQKNEIITLHHSGLPSECVDLVFIAEGYTLGNMAKFKKDARRMANYLLSQEPYKSNAGKFNITAICSPSIDGGISEPHKNNWKNTAVSASFNTFYIDRYLESTDVVAIRDIAAQVPYDHIVVLANSNAYGGGGIYNHFSISTVDHELSNTVLIHEIGHGLFGLGDEYYTSEVAYADFFDLTTEPWQPNLTTLVDFDKKWKPLLLKTTPAPTPIDVHPSNGLGVYEGGGYVAKGVYRPAIDCRMKTNGAPGFCGACIDACNKTIQQLTK